MSLCLEINCLGYMNWKKNNVKRKGQSSVTVRPG